jgi:hypothetical protein
VVEAAHRHPVSGLPTICSFWHGELTWLERMCIASFIEKGHAFALYTYDDVALPPGADRFEAASVMPREKMFFYKRDRTPAVFADLFRLELMRREAGIWADCDVLCLKRLADLPDYVFGIEAGTSANNAVFRCPPDSELLQRLLEVFQPGAIPPGMPWWRRAEVAVRRALGAELPAHEMQFGTTGPWPLNYWVKRLGLERYAQPKPVFYPLDYGTANTLLEAGSTLNVPAETLAAHLWHSALTGRGRNALPHPQPGSFFARECERLGIEL